MPMTRSQTEGKKTRHTFTSTTTKKEQKPAQKRKEESNTSSILINRAPVLTLWAAIVARREGFSFNEGLTYGRWISGMLAQSKGRSLGIFEPHEKTEAEKEARRRRDEQLGVHRIVTFGMHVPVIKAGSGTGRGGARGAKEQYAVSEGKPIDPDTVYSYLLKSFGGEESTLNAVKEAMQALADSLPKEEAGKRAYSLYERFRPEWKGWGAKGHLDLDLIRSLGAHEA